jgi:hypothetical protein
VTTLQVDVRWRPEDSPVNCAYDKSFHGQCDAVLAEAIAHIDRNYLTLTTIKHPDRAESERFWNFSLGGVEAALKKWAVSCPMLDEAHVLVDVGYCSIEIKPAAEKFHSGKSLATCAALMISVPAHPLVKAPRQKEQANALA